MILNIFGNQNKITQLPYHEFNWGEQIAVKKIIIEWISTKAKAQRYSPSYKIADYSKIFYVLKDRNSIARNRQFYNLVKRVGV